MAPHVDTYRNLSGPEGSPAFGDEVLSRHAPHEVPRSSSIMHGYFYFTEPHAEGECAAHKPKGEVHWEPVCQRCQCLDHCVCPEGILLHVEED